MFSTSEQKEGINQNNKRSLVVTTAIIGFITGLIGFIVYFMGKIRTGGIIIIIGLLFGALPYATLSFLKGKRIKEIEDEFPSFLNELAESKRGGMTLIDAFESANESDHGKLNEEIEKVYTELTWGVPFPEVMQKFSKRMEKSPVIQESLSIIIRGFKSGGEIVEVLDSVANNASDLKKIMQERKSNVKQQIYIMYLIFFLFLGITAGLYVMLSQLLGLGGGSGALSGLGEVLGGSSGPTNYCVEGIGLAQPFCSSAKVLGFVPATGPDGSPINLAREYASTNSYGMMAYYKSLLFYMLMIQGGCIAAVSGKISEGSVVSGMKHVAVMIPIAFVFFMLVIRPMGL